MSYIVDHDNPREIYARMKPEQRERFDRMWAYAEMRMVERVPSKRIVVSNPLPKWWAF